MTRPRQPDLPLLGAHLGKLRDAWDGRRLDSDPLAFPHRYSDAADREVVAFLAATMAFGRVASIRAALERLLASLGPAPSVALREGSWDAASLSGFGHRWVRGEDAAILLHTVGDALSRHGSLRALFAEGDEGGEDFVPALGQFFAALRSFAGPGAGRRAVRFLLPAPEDGSAAKRAHLFLRWTIRSGGFDLGLWSGGRFAPSRLLLPMDTHVHRIARYLGLTARAGADLKAAREATAWLRRIDPDDPVSFDWALSRLGILAECVREPRRRQCDGCAVRPVCRVARPSRGATPPTSEIRA